MGVWITSKYKRNLIKVQYHDPPSVALEQERPNKDYLELHQDLELQASL